MFKRLAFLIALASASQAHAERCPSNLPVLFLVQDKSGSMDDPPDPSCATCSSKWTQSTYAVESLTTQFSNRFRFGLLMYPKDPTTFACTTGTVINTVPASSAQITASYSAVGPGGGTPTAASLRAAKSYLQGLRLPSNEPAYVLLITDGLPNCNLTLTPGTCTATTPGCANDACGLGSKDCLDDAQSRAAAAELKAAGIKVYVVGFGKAMTSNNNRAVLDGIAAAGGTGTAYTATDQASLNQALEAVAFDAATCCQDACSQGASQCTSASEQKKCVLNAALGCTEWQITPCGPKSTCVGGTCQTCSDQCTAGQSRCNGDTAEKCQLGSNGCTAWVKIADCGYGKVCQSGACVSCEDCPANSSRCVGTQVETCVREFFTGCTEWERSNCPSGSTCQGTSCQGCAGACTKDSRRCNGAVPETCVADASGCTSWRAGAPCSEFCSGGLCGQCGNTCTVGQSRCNGRTVELCGTDANGCSDWSPTGQCSADEYCENGTCRACATKCTSGSRRCSGKTIQECQPQSNGCNAWVSVVNCTAEQTCSNGACQDPCQDACTLDQTRCSGPSVPEVCAKAATGCTVWKSGEVCTSTQLCAQGACREKCKGGEIETCEVGVCTGLPEGKVCLPDEDGPDEPGPLEPGFPDAGTGGPGGEDQAGALTGGCGCSAPAGAAAGLPVALLALGLLGFSRRRD